MLKAAQDMGIDYISTGHYAKVEFDESSNRYFLKKADCIEKDQSYMLYTLTQEQLSKVILPLQGLSKDEVRAIARKAGFTAADRGDSQEICFIPDDDYIKFLTENTTSLPPKGNFVDKDSNILGEHNGIYRYTIGQRKGLNLPMGHPVFVTDINVRDNQVVIGESEDLFTTRVVASQFNYMAVEKMEPGEEYIGKIRYAHKGTKCKVVKTWEDKVEIEFEEPVRAVTPGQNLVLYMGEYVAGGGVIIRG